MKVGLIGLGNIGKYILRKVNIDKCIPEAHIQAVFMHRKIKMKNIDVFESFDDFLQSDIDVIVEAANIKAIKNYGPDVLKAGKDLVIISVGAFVDELFEQKIYDLSKKYRSKVYLPSGAISGLDVIQAANNDRQLDKVTITTKKPASSLIDEPINQERVIYRGNAKEAIQLYPKNANVSIILSLAGLGTEQTKVQIIADPFITKNQHCIEAHGGFGQINLQIKNEPMPDNPKTSYLAALSLLSTLKNIHKTVNIV
ncbi:aspartate dehydrogenase [Salicibibacter cibi]|uniref:L-aspartate dehydrogenase n=1 Tax=Salicibibacter cibi TaxID=2743001 RepID=A0A7T6ZCS5_9BACI|nr:aspartate dehydrogenase [Salicibibacter cibi]QQK81118.1 aspartate dehydrogenase [Salicibibacter cibi]